MINSGPLPIVLLPGLDGTGELLQDLAAVLGVHRQVELLSYPLDPRLGYADLVAEVVKRAPDRPFVILGESYSGPIAIEVADTDRRVAGLILASCFARHPLPVQLASLAWAFDLRQVPEPMIVFGLMGRWATPAIKFRLSEVLAKLPRDVVQVRVREVLQVDTRDRLRRTKCPLLCLHGRRDRLVRKKSVAEIVDARSDAVVHCLDAPHMLLTTNAVEAAALINRFCGELENRQEQVV